MCSGLRCVGVTVGKDGRRVRGRQIFVFISNKLIHGLLSGFGCCARNFDPKAPPEPLEELLPSAGTMVTHLYQGLLGEPFSCFWTCNRGDGGDAAPALAEINGVFRKMKNCGPLEFKLSRLCRLKVAKRTCDRWENASKSWMIAPQTAPNLSDLPADTSPPQIHTEANCSSCEGCYTPCCENVLPSPTETFHCLLRPQRPLQNLESQKRRKRKSVYRWAFCDFGNFHFIHVDFKVKGQGHIRG